MPLFLQSLYDPLQHTTLPPSLSRFCTFVEKQEGWSRKFICPANHFISSGAHLKVSKVWILLGQRAGGNHHSR